MSTHGETRLSMKLEFLRRARQQAVGQRGRDKVHVVALAVERHVQPDLGRCVSAARQQVSVGVPTRPVWGPAPPGRLLPCARSSTVGLAVSDVVAQTPTSAAWTLLSTLGRNSLH